MRDHFDGANGSPRAGQARCRTGAQSCKTVAGDPAGALGCHDPPRFGAPRRGTRVGRNVLKAGKSELTCIQREAQIIFQDTLESLNPVCGSATVLFRQHCEPSST